MRTELQEKVVALAKEMLKGRPVCLDELPNDADIKRNGIEDCAHMLYIDTLYWDGDPSVPR